MSEERDFKQALDEYDSAKIEYTPVRAPRGRIVHASSMRDPARAVCGKAKPRGGWIAVARKLGCKECITCVHFDVKGRKQKKRRKRPSKWRAR